MNYSNLSDKIKPLINFDYFIIVFKSDGHIPKARKVRDGMRSRPKVGVYTHVVLTDGKVS